MKEKKLPNFFILGAAKAGTTALYSYLKQHPEIYLSPTKEPHFFDDETNYERGVDFYVNQHFSDADGFKARGEATPAYFHKLDYVIPRMKSVYEEEYPRFLILLRDPVERAWSHFLHRRRNRTEKANFEKALALEEKRLEEDSTLWVGYYSDGLYARQLEQWFSNFPRDRFRIFISSEFKDNQNSVLEKIVDFLGVKKGHEWKNPERDNTASVPRSEWLMDFLSRRSLLKEPLKAFLPRRIRRRLRVYLRRMNLEESENKPEMPQETRNRLRQKYRDEVLELQDMLDKDLSDWLP